MARISKRSLMFGVRGMFGKQVVYKKRRGKRYVAAPPEVDENRVPSEAEQANRDRFKRSNDYASLAVKNPELKKKYAAVAKKRQTANNVAFSDAYYPPVVSGILAFGYAGVAGNIISVQAKDNFKVVKVYVSIYDGNNNLVEKGEALDSGDGLNWIYTVTQLNNHVTGSKIIATAYDLPNNEAKREVVV